MLEAYLAAALLLAVLSIYFYTQGPGPGIQRVLAYRATRIAAALLAGAVLGGSGLFLQSALRNPLVDHYVLGIGSGAVFAAYVLYLSTGVMDPYALSLAAAVGGLAALAAAVVLAEYVGGSAASYVLAGIGVNSLFSGFSVVLAYIAVSRSRAAYYLLAGSLVAVTRGYIPVLAAALASLVVLYAVYAKPLNALLLGDEYAGQLGYRPGSVRLMVSLVAGASSAAVTACCGLIGFIGLAAPHIARLLLGTGDNRLVAPLSMITGALILLAADNASRIYLAGVVGEIPAGAISSAAGAVFYIAVLAGRMRRRV